MKIPFSPPDITEEEVEQVAEALRSGWITTGPKTKELERQVAGLCGTSRAVCLMIEYSCAVTPQIRQTGNRLSGNAGTAYASLLA